MRVDRFIIYTVFFFFFVFYVSCWNIRFRAICHFRPTNSASSGENLSNRVHLFRQLWIFETIFSPRISRFRKRSPSIPVISLSASLCSARKLITVNLRHAWPEIAKLKRTFWFVFVIFNIPTECRSFLGKCVWNSRINCKIMSPYT